MQQRRVGKKTRATAPGVRSGQRRHRPDYVLMVCVAALALIGLVFMFAVGPQRAQLIGLPDNHFLIRQAAYIGVGLVALAATMLLPIDMIRKHSLRIFGATLLLCLLLFMVGNVLKIEQIAQPVLGAYRWMNFGGITVQPSEFLKLGVLVYLAHFLGMRMKEKSLDDRDRTTLPLLALIGVVMVIVAGAQKDLGTALAIMSIMVTMFVVSGMSVKRLGLIVGALAIAGGLFVVSAPHRRDRLQTFLQPTSSEKVQSSEEKSSAGNYHIDQARIAIATGGLFGVGIGNSVQATGYLPESINDSIFAIIAETFGFLGILTLLALFSYVLLRILRISDLASDDWSKLVAAGLFGWIGAHVLFNVASMLGLMPLTGITLPLISYGGTSMVAMGMALGLLFQISRYTIHRRDKKEYSHAYSSSRRRVGRTRNTSNRRS